MSELTCSGGDTRGSPDNAERNTPIPSRAALIGTSYQPQYEYGPSSEAHPSYPGRDQPMQWTTSSQYDAQRPAGLTHSGYAPSRPSSSPENSYGSGRLSFQGQMLPPESLTAGSKRSRPIVSTASSESRTTKKSRIDEAALELDRQERNLEAAIDGMSLWFRSLHPQSSEDRATYAIVLGWRSFLNKNAILEPSQVQEVLTSKVPEIGFAPFDQFNSAIESYSKARKDAQIANAPTPTQFAHHRNWKQHQASDPILCFRPSSAVGLPIRVLHEGFRQFLVDVNDPHFEIPPAAYQAAEELCNCMGDPFDNKDARTRRLEQAIRPLWPSWTSEFYVKPFDDQSYGCVDRAAATGIFVEIKLEDGGAATSDFMQICFCFRLYVESCKKKGGPFVDAGCPTFLLVVHGERLTIYGAFWDGEVYTVESLTRGGLLMLRDYSGARQAELAHTLAALHAAHAKIRAITLRSQTAVPVPDEDKITGRLGGSPYIYRTCTLYDAPGAQAMLTFLRRWGSENSQPIWLARMTATSDTGSSSATDVVVKLPRTYGADVHRYLQGDYAPKLLGYSKLPEAPAIYVMEYLQPPWNTLFRLIRANSTLFLQHEQKIYDKMIAIIDHLMKGGFVHGNLCSNNIMIHFGALEVGDVQIKVVDFDWSGKAEETYYPGSRTVRVTWPGVNGGVIKGGHDKALFLSWWDSELLKARGDA